jgi:hypothetical protein
MGILLSRVWFQLADDAADPAVAPKNPFYRKRRGAPTSCPSPRGCECGYPGGMRTIRWLVVALLASACVPSPGPFRLQEVSGRVVDRDTGAPLAGVEVIESFRGAGAPGATQPVYHARWTTSDADGGFHFPDAVAPSARMWVLKTYAPTYLYFHPLYGLQRGGAPEQGSLLLRASLARAEQALADLQPYCRGEIDDPGARRLAEVACGERTLRPQPNENQ